ncbi:MAG TPA: hypothetical protein ENJ80_15215 [Gammaproteobacteria bacterium]|nr:hypothetical protein [Gammaproteobacteria bacterium]
MQGADRKAAFVWLILVLLTLATYAVGRLGYGGVTVVVMLLASISLKGQLIIDYFMGLAQVRSRWKWVVTGWLASVVALIGMAYWISI